MNVNINCTSKSKDLINSNDCTALPPKQSVKEAINIFIRVKPTSTEESPWKFNLNYLIDSEKQKNYVYGMHSPR